MYIREGVPDVHQGGVPDVHQGGGTRCTSGMGVLDVHFFPKTVNRSEYPPLSDHSPWSTHYIVLGDPPG